MLTLWTGVIVLLLRKVLKSQMNIQFSCSLHILWGCLLLRLRSWCFLMCCAENSAPRGTLLLSGCLTWGALQWQEPFVSFRVTFIQSVLVCSFWIKCIFCSTPAIETLVCKKGSCVWSSRQFRACGKFRLPYFFLLWKWLHGMSHVAVIYLSCCPLWTVYEGLWRRCACFCSLEFLYKNLGRPPSKFWRRGVCILYTPMETMNSPWGQGVAFVLPLSVAFMAPKLPLQHC